MQLHQLLQLALRCCITIAAIIFYYARLVSLRILSLFATIESQQPSTIFGKNYATAPAPDPTEI